MKDIKNENGLIRFLKFFMTDSPRFRIAVFHFPLITGVGSFILNWLILDKGFSYSLTGEAFVFLLVCFIGIVGEIFRRRNLR
jgi:hypothetical protein